MGRANKNQAYVSLPTDDEWRSGPRANSFVSKWVLGTAMIYGFHPRRYEALLLCKLCEKEEKWLEKNEAFVTKVKHYCDA